MLRDAIKERTKKDPKKMKQNGLEEIEFWLKEAVRRGEGEKRDKERQREEKYKSLMFHRNEDNVTSCRRRKGVAEAEEGKTDEETCKQDT